MSSPSILDHINDENDEANAISDFRSLIKHNGWQRIVRYLSDKAEHHQEQLNSSDEIKSMEDLRIIRFKRNMAEQLTNLPEILTEIIETRKRDDEDDLDPFE